MTRIILAGVGAALLLLTWLLLRGFSVDHRPFDEAMQALAEIEMAESAIRRDLLAARAGLLRDYDPLVGALRRFEAALVVLHDKTTPQSLDRLKAWHERQEALVESIKSANALLQNSLAQFSRLSILLSAPPDGAMPVAGAGRLGSAVLHLTLDTSPAVVSEVRRGLTDLHREPVAGRAAEAVSALLAHGWLLHDLLPRVDGLLRELQSHAGGSVRHAIATEVQDRRMAAELKAGQYRLLLYACAVLLLLGLLLLGIRLRARSDAMRRHAAFQNMLARLSARLIGTQADEADTGLDHALEEISRRLGAYRAYLLVEGPAPVTHLWSEDGTAHAQGWAHAVLALTAAHSAQPAATLRMPPGHPDLLALPGQPHAWFAAVRRTGDGVAAVLGCEMARPGRIPAEPELASLGLALDALLNLVTRRSLEAERSRLAAREVESRQMQMLGTFASGIAHNFNNIIGAILGFAEMAMTERSPARIADIRRAAERARDLASDILAFGGPQQTAQHGVELGTLLTETELLLRAMLPAQVQLAFEAMPEAAFVWGDGTALQQVIVNLVRNAAQAMDGAGVVTLQVEARTLREHRALRLGALRPDHYVLIRVQDTGRGMDAATRERIFEPFFTTRQAGHGLGLATVREIVLVHGGGIAVSSAPGEGSCFEVWLPRAVAAEVARNDLPRGEGEPVLLLHGDDRLPREEELLAMLGYEPHGFSSLPDALGALRVEAPVYSAALLLEGSSEMARTLRLTAPGLPIIIASATPLAGFEWIAWPLMAEELARSLRQAVLQAPPSAQAAPVFRL
ncbi:two-component system VirA-like sensor kinase [Roseomonas frigidaquae]|uniref:histidine kinase n=1 Tax=Falsiroseomonas frigidaquae TaxID=487318 RepID=A0ABX1F473_9PROT|nr:two-component system VirA-like sensor kinase [Falsiroseomonas frigidaquae]NKE47162.1 two-component system VirA-like sensor kinase [Falsiroseomonas frigidaquae]